MATDESFEARLRREAKREIGECTACPNEAAPNKRKCHKCLKKDRKRRRGDGRSTKLYHKRKKAGLCVQCGKRPRGRFLRCQQCRIDLSLEPRDWWSKLQKKGICAKCKGPSSPSKRDPTKMAFRCDKCAAEHAAVMKAHHRLKRSK